MKYRPHKNPVISIVNGRGDTVVLGLQDYYQMKSELELLRMLADAEEDVKHGRAAFIQKSFAELSTSLQQRRDL